MSSIPQWARSSLKSLWRPLPEQIPQAHPADRMAQIRVAGKISRLDGKLKLSPVAYEAEAARSLWEG